MYVCINYVFFSALCYVLGISLIYACYIIYFTYILSNILNFFLPICSEFCVAVRLWHEQAHSLL